MKWLLDPGHGGISFGHYLTPGKRSPSVPPGIYEGEFNRSVCGLIQQRDPDNILVIAPGPINIPLASRVKYVNQLVRRLRSEPVALISVHANASPKPGWSDSNGFVLFLTRNASKATEEICYQLDKSLDENTPLSSRGIHRDRLTRGFKRRNFTIIQKTRCPAALVECGFMTHEGDARYLSSWIGKHTIADAIYRAMQKCVFISP